MSHCAAFCSAGSCDGTPDSRRASVTNKVAYEKLIPQKPWKHPSGRWWERRSRQAFESAWVMRGEAGAEATKRLKALTADAVHSKYDSSVMHCPNISDGLMA